MKKVLNATIVCAKMKIGNATLAIIGQRAGYALK